MEDNKVLGIEANKYAKIAYVLILISVVIGLLNGLAGLVGSYVPFGGVISILGLVGLVMAVLGLFVFQDNFNDLDQSHFKYIGLLFIAFFIIGIIFSNGLAGFGFVGALINLAISAAAFIFMFAGYRTHQAGTPATRASIEGDIRGMVGQAKSKVQKNQSSGSEGTGPQE